jgi:hypothetical protein
LTLLLATIAQLLMEISSVATFSPSAIAAELVPVAANIALLDKRRIERMTLLNMAGSDK